jgi:hypothetical protein
MMLDQPPHDIGEGFGWVLDALDICYLGKCAHPFVLEGGLTDGKGFTESLMDTHMVPEEDVRPETHVIDTNKIYGIFENAP